MISRYVCMYVLYTDFTITIAASLKFSEILAATFSATWLGLRKEEDRANNINKMHGRVGIMRICLC